MNIPVNGSMADGCICKVTMVRAESSGSNLVNVFNIEGVKGCGYKVVNYNTFNNDSWTCSDNEIVYYRLSLNESFQLTFTRDSTTQPTSTGFCLHITTTIFNIDTNNTFTITCWRNDATTTETTSPQPETQARTNPKPTSQATTIPNTSREIMTSVGGVALGEASTDRTAVSGITSIIGSTEPATLTSNNVLPAGIAVGVSFGFLVLIIIIVILICIIRRKDKTHVEYVSKCTCRRSDVNHPENMYDVMTPREDNHQYEMSPVQDSNATADDVQPTYAVMVNRSSENNYQILAPPVTNGVYVNQ
ncbi:uncharacterized protein LOC126830409 isoform X2 [Patella vulgata]|uniref:uncharacterized protein LOC126830409 isoform X2 n=1 Tax=Patella vulgata TaxID=6465 RepID=UPI00217FA09A|nr:uncharacterized protein LOC126830409 isoform X2 [Patella vulgata]